MTVLWIVLAAVAGLLFGSFANVVIYRVPLRRSVVTPGSACPSCRTPLAPRDNIPVVSWFLLKGRCRHCGAGISVRYPIVEALTALLFVLTVLSVPRATDLIAYLPLAWVLVVLSFIDLDHKILPNRIVLPSIGAGVVLFGIAAAVGPGVGGWVRGIASGVCAFLVFLVLAIISPRGMGIGDVKLAALLGMSLGYLGQDGIDAGARVFAGFFLAFLIGALGGLLLMLTGRAGARSQVPFGPYLALGTLVGIFWGATLVELWIPR